MKRYKSKICDSLSKIKARFKSQLSQIDYLLKSYCSPFLNRYLPKSNIIFFESHQGLTISCSPLAIYEAIKSEDSDIKCVWSYSNKELILPDGCRGVLRYSWKYLYYLARAKVWIQNSEFPFYQSPSPQVLYINTQHGTPLKKLTSDIHYRRKDKSVGAVRNNVRWDYLITDNGYSTEIYERLRHPQCRILEIGYPRNDSLLRNDISVEALKNKYQLPIGDKPVVLYAPTYREYADKLDFYDLIMQLPKSVRNRFTFLVRSHHLNNSPKVVPDVDLIDVSAAKYDIQELCKIADILLTDYSSVMFDFLYLNKPIILFPFDFELYDQYRGMYFDIRDSGVGPVAYDLKQLTAVLEETNFAQAITTPEFIALRNDFCKSHCGEASKKIADIAIQFLNGVQKKNIKV